MPNSEKIELLISPEALKQFERLKPIVDENTASFEKLIAKAVELNKAVGSATTFKEINKATAEMTDNEKALAKQMDELAKANAKLNALYSDEAKKLAEIKVQQQEQNKALKEQAKEALGLSGAYDKLTKEYNEAAKAAKDLAIQFGAGSKEAKEASARALELDARLKAADANVGRFNKNVGNYSGALDVLKGALQNVGKKIDEFKSKGTAANTTTNAINNSYNKATTVIKTYNTTLQDNENILQSLEKEQQLLQQLLEAQVSGFASGTQEVRANTKALEALAAAGLQGTEAYQKLFAATANLKDEVSDLKTALKNAAPDDVAFNAATDAAKGLVGVYGFAQSAAAVFGEKNEALQETLIKLQAAETALQSIEAIRAVFKKENAVRQAIEIVQGKVIIAQKYLETAAESKNIVVKYAAIAAQKALNFATSAAGGPLLLLIGLLATAFVSMAAYGDATEDAAKKNERLNKSLERTNKAIDKSASDIKAAGDKSIAQLEDNFATEESLRGQREENLQKEIDNIKKFNVIDAKNREDAIREVARLTSGKNKQDKEAIDKAIQVRDGYLANLQKQTDLENQLEILRLTNSRVTKEEIIKAKQDEIEAQKSQLQTALQLQQSIAGNERKTQKDRINALKEAEKIQEQIINKDANSKRLNPTLTPSEIKAIEAARTAALTQARRESNKAIEDLNRSYAERERKARFDIIRTEIEDQIKADDLIVQNEKNGFDKRLDALYDGYQKRRDIVIAQHDLDIQNDTLTAEERIAIEQKYISDINGLTVEYGLQQQQLYQQNQDKVNEIIEKGQQARKDIISKNESLAIVELNDQRSKGLIGIEDYENKRAAIELSARIQSLNEDRKLIFGRVLLTKEGTAEREAAEKELADNTKAISDELLNAEEKNNARRLDNTKTTIQAIADIYSNLFNSISEISSIQSDAEKAQIQQQLDQLDKQEEKDKKVAESSITNAQDKAKALSEIEARAQAKRESLERRQRQLDRQKAQFDKAANIANIITGTALAIVNTLKDPKLIALGINIPLAAAIGALGAAQLARAIAAPLPQFEHGTDDAPGGLAVVGEKRRELVITPDGKVMQTPAVPTVMNVPKHSIVLPDARAALESGLAVNRHGQLVDKGSAEFKEVGHKIEQKIETLTKVMRNKPVLNMNADQGGLTAMWKYGANWVTYADDQTRF